MADAMANINALIAQGPKPIQLNDPLGQMAKMYQIKSAQQELTANEQKLAEANALREFLKSNPDLTSSATLNKLTTGFGPTGLAYGTKLLEIEKARRAERTAEQKLVDDKTKYFRDALSGVNTPDDARMWTAAIYSDPNLGPVFKGMGVTAEQAIARIPTDPAQFENWKRNAALGATKFAELNKPQFFQQDLGGSRRIIAMPGMGGAAEVVPGSAALKTSPPTTSSLERLIAARDALPVGSADRLAIEAQINKDIAGNRVFDPNTGLLVDKVTGQPVTPGATPAGQPGATPLVPGIAPVQAQQNQTGGFPRVTPQVQAARDTDRLAILERELASQQAAGRVDPALQAEIDNARRQAGVPAPQTRAPVNALPGAAPSVNALAGAAPTGAAPSNPAEAKIAYTQQQQALYEPVQVIDPASGNTVYVSKAEAIRRGMTPAEKSTDLTPKQIQQLELKFPQATNAVKTFESKAESLEKDLKRLAEHPGLSGISGGIFGISGRTPALTKAAREAEALYNSIIARGGFNELQSMRSASPTGGALGNVSNQENQYLRDAFAPIKLTQDTADLKKALLDAANSVAGSRQRIRETYDMTYEYRKNRGGATSAPASGGVDTNNPLLRGKD